MSILRHLVTGSAIALALFGSTGARASAAVLTFDSLNGTTGGIHLPADHQGFGFGDRWFAMSTAAAPTQTFLATSTVGSTLIRRTDGGTFYFDGADFWSRRGLDANGDFFFVLYNGASTVYQGNLKGKKGRMRFAGTPRLLTPGYKGAITALAFGFDNDDSDHLAMDNFRFRPGTALSPAALRAATAEFAPSTTASVGSVPEPTTLALLLGALGVAGGRRRRA